MDDGPDEDDLFPPPPRTRGPGWRRRRRGALIEATLAVLILLGGAALTLLIVAQEGAKAALRRDGQKTTCTIVAKGPDHRVTLARADDPAGKPFDYALSEKEWAVAVTGSQYEYFYPLRHPERGKIGPHAAQGPLVVGLLVLWGVVAALLIAMVRDLVLAREDLRMLTGGIPVPATLDGGRVVLDPAGRARGHRPRRFPRMPVVVAERTFLVLATPDLSYYMIPDASEASPAQAQPLPPQEIDLWGRSRLTFPVFFGLFYGIGLLFLVPALTRRHEALRLGREGVRTRCDVSAKEKWFLRLKRHDDPARTSFDLRVDGDRWRSVEPGMEIEYAYDPRTPTEGMLEADRKAALALFNTSTNPAFAILLVATFLLGAATAMRWRARRNAAHVGIDQPHNNPDA